MTWNELVDKVTLWLVENGTAFVINLVVALILLFIAKVLIRMIVNIALGALRRTGNLNDMVITFTGSVLSKLLWLVAWVLVLSQLGVEVAPLIAGLGIFGFVVGFAFQESLGNLAAGFMIMLNAPFKVGDYVEIAGQGGSIREINLMATILTTPDNRVITIPNRAVWGQQITNYSTMETRRVDMTFGVSYGADLAKTREVLEGVLKSNDKILPEPAPMIEVVALQDSSVNFVVRPWVKNADYWPVFFATQKQIKEALDAAGIEIPFPQRVVHMVNDSAA